MTRVLYKLLLALHPPAFRREFAVDMLWIFDEEHAAPRFMADAAASLFRQWLVRSGVWIAAVACAGGFLPLVGGVAIGEAIRYGIAPLQTASKAQFVLLTSLACLVAIACTLTVCVVWFRRSRPIDRAIRIDLR